MNVIKTEELKEMLKTGKVHFEFAKRDGTLREAFGTLNMNYIPENMRPSDSSTNRNITTLRYFDLDKNEWRSVSGDTTEVKVL